MGYAKVVKYSNIIEIYTYEEDIRPITRKSRELQVARRNQSVALSRKDPVEQEKSYQRKRKDNARRLFGTFRRLISANLGESENPIFASFTYAEYTDDPNKGHSDFNSFARALRYRFGQHIRYIAVPEYQKSGRLHFHALLWGLPLGVVRAERSTRMVASLWKQGFVDLKETDGHEKLAFYMAKYMAKAHTDKRLFMKKSFIASRNIKRPVVDKRAIVIQHIYENELSTAEPSKDIEFETQWLGTGRYRLYELST